MSSLRRTDLLSLSQLRNDGRKSNEIRRMRIQMSPISGGGGSKHVSGSALVQMGLTVALASVRGPMECIRRSDELPDRAILDVTVRQAPFAPSNSDRRYINPNTDRRLLEQSNLIKRAMEASILLHLHPKGRIEINVIVLADDGGRLCACINAVTLALIDAGVPMKDMVCACSAGLAPGLSLGGSGGDGGSGAEIIDLNKLETMGMGGESAVYLPCAIMPQRGTVVLAQCESRLNVKIFERVMEAAMEGCRAVFDVMQAAVRERSSTLLAAKNGNAFIETPFDL
mmetsp:Transcript_13890/g.20264  ORF Transcript_13890/g.20264 Transcript_13890/m.20264 type:complete len:284 (+) Transcript_13890:97-948(+)